MAWLVRSTRAIYDNPWIRVREDEVVRPDRATGIYGVVEVKRTAVFVVAVTQRDEIWLLTVNRHTVGPSLEVPAGGADLGEDDLLAAAQRELAEEVGLEAGSWVQLGEVDSLNGVCRAPGAVFLARDLSLATGRNAAAMTASEQHREGISGPRAVPMAEVLELVRSGAIRDGETLAALLLALVHLGRVG